MNDLKKYEIKIEINEETYSIVKNLVNYENLKNNIMQNERLPINESDIVKAALNYYLHDVRNFYKQKIGSQKGNLLVSRNLKNRIQEIIDKLNLKQKDLVELTGIDKANISIILNNHSQPSMDYFIRIWLALDCPNIEDMFYYED